MRGLLLSSGLLILALTWAGPLPALAVHSFSAHMTMHMAVVAVAAPLVALGVAGSARDPVARWPTWFSAIPASILELVVVWSWHAPALHHAARQGGLTLAIEQLSFLLAGVVLWVSAAAGHPREASARRAAGVAGLLFTSTHMTLLGALFALTPRPLYAHAAHAAGGLSPLDDQHLGGAIMLLVGGASYLAGGLWLAREVLRSGPAASRLAPHPGGRSSR
jgi:putative membrane protein